jgi:Uma2 family endonuclease
MHSRCPAILSGTAAPKGALGSGGCAQVRATLLIKKPYYARIGVRHHWIVDLEARTVAAYELEAGRWVELCVWGDEKEAHLPPFEEVGLNVASSWPPTEPDRVE